MARSTYTINNAIEFKVIFDKIAVNEFKLETVIDPRGLGYTIETLRVKLSDALKYLADKFETKDLRYLRLKRDLKIKVINSKIVIKRINVSFDTGTFKSEKIRMALAKSFNDNRLAHNLRRAYIACLDLLNADIRKQTEIPYIITLQEFHNINQRLRQLKPDYIIIDYNHRTKYMVLRIDQEKLDEHLLILARQSRMKDSILEEIEIIGDEEDIVELVDPVLSYSEGVEIVEIEE